ncbi:hypothetical protein EG327_009298 [Venturia inaequalis]|uniref:Uncharacterized protein n=1 Tax=Venturia inaequalis TaxID=5025 RepID=A0A8H3VT28_VENIN|nr:hypothetical protein EG327_009298 [Venturia inaequalis]
MAYHRSRDYQLDPRGRRIADDWEGNDEWRDIDPFVTRGRNANVGENRKESNTLRPSYRHVDADLNLRARLQRPPEDSVAFHTALRPYGGFRSEYDQRPPEPRSRLAVAPDEIYPRIQRHRRSDDVLNPGYGAFPEAPEAIDPILEDGFDLELTFQREDTWAPSAIESESSLIPEPGGSEKESTDRTTTQFNVLTSWAWGLGPNLLSGGELHGFVGSSRRRQSCHFRWLHTQQNNMDFDSFFLNAIRTAEFKGSERSAVLKLQETIRARFVKPVTAGQTIRGRQMTPNVFFGNLAQDRSVRIDRLTVPRPSILFFSVPFFVLRDFAENNLAPRSGLFPTRALLQSQNSAVKKARELSQALRRLQHGNSDICLHVSQVWCLAFGNDHLFTCSTLALEDLLGESCKINTQPRPDHNSPPTVRGRQYITVRSTNEIITLPLDQCGTWLAFVSHFGAQTVNFEESYHLKWQGREVTWDTWAVVYQNILKSNSPLHLEARRPERCFDPAVITDGIENEFDLAGVRMPSQRPSTRAIKSGPVAEAYRANLYVEKPESKPAGQIIDLETFHAFTWICAVPDRQSAPGVDSSSEKIVDTISDRFRAYNLDASRYRKALLEIDEFLETRLAPKETQIYGNTPAKNMLDISEDDNIPKPPQAPDEPEDFTTERGPPRRGPNPRERREERFTFAPANDSGEDQRPRSRSPYIRPYQSESDTRSRGRGRYDHRIPDYEDEAAFEKSLSPPPPAHRRPPPLSQAIKRVKTFRDKDFSAFVNLAQRMERIGSIFEAHRKEGGCYFKIPSAFSNAWLHCLLFVVQHASPVHESHKMAKKSLEQCILLIDQGLAEIMASLAPSPLHENMALQPRGVMALIINRLIEDVVGDSPDVLSTYASYMDELKAKIEDDPLQRIHQRTISYFNEEIEAIIRVLEGQGQVIADLTDITSTSDRSFLSPATSMERGRTEFGRAFELLWEQKSFLLQRIVDFTGLAKEALVLESFVKKTPSPVTDNKSIH